jgi:hypothetical protein
MTRPNIRPHERKRCNVEKNLHRLDCTGHEASRSSRVPRVVAQQMRREREKADRLSNAQRARVQKRYGDKLLMSLPEHDSGFSEDVDQWLDPYRGFRATGVRRQAAVMSPPAVLRRAPLVKCSKCPDRHISEARAHGFGYCHGYRLPTEHYHQGYDDLVACDARKDVGASPG